MRFATLADSKQIEDICNNPLLRMWTAPEGWPPCSGIQYVTEPSFTIIGDEGCLLVPYIDGNRFALHVNLLPHCRGANALIAGKQAMTMVFSRPEVHELIAAIPRSLPHSIWIARQFGFRHWFDKPNAWPVGGMKFDVRIYRLTRQEWMKHCEGENRNEVCHA